MHGTWYKGPQLVHHSHTEYHQFRSYPSFVVSPYHAHETAAAAAVAAAAASSTNPPTAPCAPCATPILVDNAAGAYTGLNQQLSAGPSTQLTVLSPTIKVEQSFPEPLGPGVDDYALNLECNGVEQIFKVGYGLYS